MSWYRHCMHGCMSYPFQLSCGSGAGGRYSDLTACMHSISLEELIMAVRRQSQGFSRGSSTYRGVTHHPSGEPTSTLRQATVSCVLPV